MSVGTQNVWWVLRCREFKKLNQLFQKHLPHASANSRSTMMKSSRSSNPVSAIRKAWTSLSHSMCQLELCRLRIWRWLQEVSSRRWTVVTISLPLKASTDNKHNPRTIKNPCKVVRACSWGTPRRHRVPKETSTGPAKEARSCHRPMKGLLNRRSTANSGWIKIQVRILCNTFWEASKIHKEHRHTSISLLASQDRASSPAPIWETRNRYSKSGKFLGRMHNSREPSLKSRSPNHKTSCLQISHWRQ